MPSNTECSPYNGLSLFEFIAHVILGNRTARHAHNGEEPNKCQ
jgi:hypothetical protein